MSLVFAAIAPHGTLPEAPVAGAEATHAALAELGRRFDAAEPEATIVLTPHNVHIEGAMAVIVAGHLEGVVGEDGREIWMTSPVDLDLGLALLDELERAGVSATPVSYGGNRPAEAGGALDDLQAVVYPLGAVVAAV